MAANRAPAAALATSAATAALRAAIADTEPPRAWPWGSWFCETQSRANAVENAAKKRGVKRPMVRSGLEWVGLRGGCRGARILHIHVKEVTILAPSHFLGRASDRPSSRQPCDYRSQRIALTQRAMPRAGSGAELWALAGPAQRGCSRPVRHRSASDWIGSVSNSTTGMSASSDSSNDGSVSVTESASAAKRLR